MYNPNPLSNYMYFFKNNITFTPNPVNSQVSSVFNEFTINAIYYELSYHMSLSVQHAITKYHIFGGLNNTHLFSHSTGVQKSEIRVPAFLGSSEGPPPNLQTTTSVLYPHMAKTKQAYWCLFS